MACHRPCSCQPIALCPLPLNRHDPTRVKLCDAECSGHFRTFSFLTPQQYLAPLSLPSFCHWANRYLLSTNCAPSPELSTRNFLLCWFPGHTLFSFAFFSEHVFLVASSLALCPLGLSPTLGSSPVFLGSGCASESPAICAQSLWFGGEPARQYFKDAPCPSLHRCFSFCVPLPGGGRPLHPLV